MKQTTRKRRDLVTWFSTTATPLFVLNGKRQLVFFNQGCEELTGWKQEDVLGKTCEYTTDPDHKSVESLTSCLCPPPDVFSGQNLSLPTYLVHKSGRSFARLLNFLPLHGPDGVQHVLGVVTEIQEPVRTGPVSAVQQLHAELAALRHSLRQRFGIKGLVCRSEAMVRVAKQIQLAIASEVPVTVIGERGTGKEHIARTIHYEGAGRTRSFVPVDCRRLTSRQLKRVLASVFEEEPDQTPGAPAMKPGTLFLQDVDSLPPDLQSLLVESFKRDTRGTNPPVRLIASTTTYLSEGRGADAIRDEFYYLMTALQIELPPLKCRLDDLQPLAQYFLESLNRGAERQISGFADDVWRQFREYGWPGNLDELATVVEEARAACTESVITAAHLPFRFRTGLAAQAVGPPVGPDIRPLSEMLATAETEHIQQVLMQCRYNKTQAAKLLGIPRAKLYRRMQSLGIEDIESS